MLAEIFKKNRDNYVGRFDAKNPISAKLPNSSDLIINEVQFFKIKNCALSKEDPPNLKAEFFGTDYNFLHSEAMRTEMLINCPRHIELHFGLHTVS